MPLKLTVGDLNEISEAQRGLYRQRQEGGFILDIEGGAVAKSTLDEFRNKNIDLLKRIKDAGDIDPEQFSTLRTENLQLRGDLEKARKGASADAEARVKAVEKSRDVFRQRLEGVLIDAEVTKAATQIGAHPTALDDDGRPVAVDQQGNKLYGEDGQPLGIDGAVRQLTQAAPHLFKPSSGGGAANTSGSAGRLTNGQGNPFKKGESFNLTEQSRLLKHDRAEATRLAAEAGVTL